MENEVLVLEQMEKKLRCNKKKASNWHFDKYNKMTA